MSDDSISKMTQNEATNDVQTSETRRNFYARLREWTTIPDALASLAAPPANGLAAWARTTGGIVALLIALQIKTGMLLAFYYVPASAHAHTTVEYIEKVLPAGSWLRALHFYTSQLLPLALLLHLAQMFFVREIYRERIIAWLATVVLLALVLGASATGYALTWDARALDGIGVAAGLTTGFPLIGATFRKFLLDGSEITTLTLSRFYALHVFITPSLILLTIFARLFIFKPSAVSRQPSAATQDETENRKLKTENRTADSELENQFATRIPHSAIERLARQFLVAGIVFFALAFYAAHHPAAFGPAPEQTPRDYLPRPGAQFLWLFELLKFLDGATATLAALIIMILLFGGLFVLPFIGKSERVRLNPRIVGASVFACVLLVVGGLTALAKLSDWRNIAVRNQLIKQQADEAIFRRAAFKPQDLSPTGANANATNAVASTNPPPAAYTQSCARCHGANGEGVPPRPSLIGVSNHPFRTQDDIVKLLDNPSDYGLSRQMPSFKDKLSDEDKRRIAQWVVTLK